MTAVGESGERDTGGASAGRRGVYQLGCILGDFGGPHREDVELELLGWRKWRLLTLSPPSYAVDIELDLIPLFG